MAIKYYYIDDDPIATTGETAKGLSVIPNRLKVIPHQHKKWEEEINFLIENQDEFDGLLLDWGLTGKNAFGEEANFNIEALVQQIRRLTIDNKKIKKDFPIALCSANYRFKQVFAKELTSHDLFDIVYEKDDFNDNAHEVIDQLIDLAKGYKNMQEEQPNKKLLETILGLKDFELVDYRIINHLESLIKENKPPHEIARFILSKVLKNNGVLINQYLLAARLGVDIINKDNNAEWTKLLKKLNSTKYIGVFSAAWERWWMTRLNIWWEKNFTCALGSINGPERVELLNQKYDLKLVPAKITAKSKNEFFWTICKESHCPIAIEDGLLSSSAIDKAPWEEDEYYSIDKVLELDANSVHPLEKGRLKKLKTLYAKTRVK